MTSPASARPLGRTGLTVTAVTVGTSALGRPALPEEQAQAALAAALAEPLSIDTGNNYGLSEQRLGRAWKDSTSQRRLLATKVDPAPDSADFSGARVRASLQESMDRLGVDHFALVHLHDPERMSFDDAMSADGPVRALLELRDAGVVDHLGVAGGPVALLRHFVETGHFEAVVTHNRYTLVDRSAAPLLDQCADRGIGVFNAAPYGGGFLSSGADGPETYCYRPANRPQLAARRAMADACAAHGVELAAAALQFSLADQRISSTIVGMSSARQFTQTLAWANTVIPDELWPVLEEFVPPTEHQLGPTA